MVRFFLRALPLACLLAGHPTRAGESARPFGFLGPEIFPVENFISNLRVADLDRDGRNDLVVANNVRSRITILYNETGRTNLPSSQPAGSRELNDLPPDARFHIESIASEKRVSSLVLADLNNDARPDLVYYGEPRELIVLYGRTNRTWSLPKRWLITDAQLGPNALAAGDITGDSRPDLLLLAESHVYLLRQGQDGTLEEPTRLPLSSPAKSLQILDANADGRNDLLLVNWEDRIPFRVRLQQADGQLGPEFFFEASPTRACWADSLLPSNSPPHLVSIAQNSGRAHVYEFTRREPEPLLANLKQGQFSVYPLTRTDRARRGMLWTDLDGNALPDLVVAEPESGQITLFLQQTNGTLAPPQTHPSLAGLSQLAAGDWDADGHAELFLLSPDERQVGVTRLDANARLGFPGLLPSSGRPLVMALCGARSNAPASLALITEQGGRRSLELRTADGSNFTQKLDSNYGGNPAALAFHDADQDGLPDLVLLTPYERIKILRNNGPNEPYQEIDLAPPGGAVDRPWLSSIDVDHDGKFELLLAQRNFVRATVLRPATATRASDATNRWRFEVKEQMNGAESNSRLSSAAMLDAGAGRHALFLLDAERKAVTVCERDAVGVWRVARNIPLPVAEFDHLQPVQLGIERRPALALMGMNAVGLLTLDGQVWQLTELDGYETPVKEGRLNDLITGDLNGDGRKELVFLETGRNYVDVVQFTKDRKLAPGERWQVFEERTFRGRSSGMPEPREAAVSDVTGDGKDDLIVLVHDRLLVYPQE